MPWSDRLDAVAAQRFPDLEILSEEPMSRHTTFRIGGPARRFCRPASVEQLVQLLSTAESEDWPVLVVGNGSNLLVSDDGLDFLVIQTGRLDLIEKSGPSTLRASAGVSLAKLSAFAQKQALSGLEFAHGIPGTLGGAVCMNAGAYGGEMAQVVSAVTVWFPDDGVARLERDALMFGYRHSVFSDHPGIVLEAELVLEDGEGGAVLEKMEDMDRRRREKQPLIEQCGLKGFQVGGAQVSEKHAGFIVNAGGATSEDVRQLIGQIQRTVLNQTGVVLEPEIKLIP